MGIAITDVLGTKVYLAPKGTVVTTATQASDAATAGKQILCLQELGDVSESKSVTEYSCLEGGDATKSFGSKTLGNFQLDVLYDAADSAGQADMVTMWDNTERRQIIVEMSDGGGTSPSYVTFEIGLSTQTMSFQKDGAVMYKNTAEQTSKRVLIKAVA